MLYLRIRTLHSVSDFMGAMTFGLHEVSLAPGARVAGWYRLLNSTMGKRLAIRCPEHSQTSHNQEQPHPTRNPLNEMKPTQSLHIELDDLDLLKVLGHGA